MKKNNSVAVPEKADEKGAFYHAGEMIGSIGFHIVDGKDKLIGAIKNKLGKKQTQDSKVKKDSKKKLSGKTGKKNAGSAKKPAKKTARAKATGEKTGKVKKSEKSVKEKE